MRGSSGSPGPRFRPNCGGSSASRAGSCSSAAVGRWSRPRWASSCSARLTWCSAKWRPWPPASGPSLRTRHCGSAASSSSSSTTGAARLAFLAACGTARASERLSDGAIHITSAFLLAGFPTAVGTLWEIDSTHADHVTAASAAGPRGNRHTAGPSPRTTASAPCASGCRNARTSGRRTCTRARTGRGRG
ncbi:CHAT domain-containing protein [Streptomyces sp. NPDC051051]|uniref:CHAT domain-containing protein n=1 Tax=Streptomyces sp. NPDC051051 TaxID=3155666 RepID=UPI003419E2EE